MNLFLMYLLLFSVSSSPKDTTIEDFKEVEVLFYNTHSQYELIAPTFDTLAVSYLSTERHREGAQFETVTEQVKVQPSYKEYKIQASNDIPIIVNAETGAMDTIQCLAFLPDPELIERQATYGTKVVRVVKTDGDGEWVEEKMDTFYQLTLIDHGNYRPSTARFQDGNITKFRIPAKESFAEYLITQLDDSIDCFYGD